MPNGIITNDHYVKRNVFLWNVPSPLPTTLLRIEINSINENECVTNDGQTSSYNSIYTRTKIYVFVMHLLRAVLIELAAIKNDWWL